MSNIFEKNITALAVKNPDLAARIQKHIPSEIPQLVQENGAYNLIYKGKHIHNQQNPIAEAHEIFARATNEPVAIHLIYGLGLGYLFQVCSLKSNGTVILYEPDLNIFRIAFTLVDFSNDINKANIYLTDNMEDVASAIYKKSGTKNFPQLLSLNSQREFNPESFQDLVRNLQDLIGSYTLDLKYTKEKFFPSLKFLLRNIPNVIKETPLVNFKDSYKGKTAVIVSAGPTLDRNIESLKKNREKYILFVVGTAAKTLHRHNIKPDFLCSIEIYNSSKHLTDIDLSETILITEPYSCSAIRNFKFKNIYSHISANMPINHLWAELSGEKIEEYWSKGTVSYTALNCARLLGFSKIILVGQDLAYLEGQCYSKDSAYKDLICGINPENGKWEIMAKDFETFASNINASPDEKVRTKFALERLQNLNNSLYTVKGINGDMIPTESVYASFIKPLTEYTEQFNDRHYINTSLVGAQIDGFENMSLEEALKDSTEIKPIELKTDFKYDIESIKQKLQEKVQELDLAKNLIAEGKHLLKNLNNSLKRRRTIDIEILKELKKTTLKYVEISNDFSGKSKLFDFITSAEKIDLDYEMKMMQEFTIENINKLSETLSQYYNQAESKIKEVEYYLNQDLRML